MALHKIKIKRPDGTVTFFENLDGTWDCCLHNTAQLKVEPPNWYSKLSTQLMISTMCAAADLGAEITIEKSEDN